MRQARLDFKGFKLTIIDNPELLKEKFRYYYNIDGYLTKDEALNLGFYAFHYSRYGEKKEYKYTSFDKEIWFSWLQFKVIRCYIREHERVNKIYNERYGKAFKDEDNKLKIKLTVKDIIDDFIFFNENRDGDGTRFPATSIMREYIDGNVQPFVTEESFRRFESNYNSFNYKSAPIEVTEFTE